MLIVEREQNVAMSSMALGEARSDGRLTAPSNTAVVAVGKIVDGR